MTPDTYLRLERKRVPDDVLYEADRLHCLLFSGYDPYFEGDAPQAYNDDVRPSAISRAEPTDRRR